MDCASEINISYNTIQININTIQTSTIQDTKKTIKMYDSNLWHTDMQEKSTLTIYRKYKHSIKNGQNLYNNSAGIHHHII